MRKLLLFLIVVLGVGCLFSCVQQNQQSPTTEKNQSVEPYKVQELIDTMLSKYPNTYVNDVQKERAIKFLRQELNKKLTKDYSFLSEIPMEFRTMLKTGHDKYIIKFECGEYTTNDMRLISETSKTAINYAIFAKVNAELASTLEDGAMYILTGEYKGFVDGKLRLPSGNLFDYDSNCYKFSGDEYASICLGGFLFDKIKFTKTHIQHKTR